MKNKIYRQFAAFLLAAIMIFSCAPLQTVFGTQTNLAGFGLLTVNAAAKIPATPGSPKAVSASYNSIYLSWRLVLGATGYVTYRYNPASKTYARLKVTNKTSCTDTGLVTGRTYYYKVRAYKTVNGKNILGNPSGAFSAKPKLSAPSSFTVIKASNTSAYLNWKAVSGASGYLVYWSSTSNGTFLRVNATTSTSYLDEGIGSNKSHYYKVVAYRKVNGANVFSAFSPVKVVTLTTPTTAAPTTAAPTTAAPTTAAPTTTVATTTAATTTTAPLAVIVTQSKITGTFMGWAGDTVFSLLNGEVWQQDSPGIVVTVKILPSVTIIKETGGKYKMSVAGVTDSIYVKKLDTSLNLPIIPPLTSQIKGTFEGWTGSTVFQLINGQVWMQTSPGLIVTVKIMPTVTITQDGTKYKMAVDGITDTINVKRIV